MQAVLSRRASQGLIVTIQHMHKSFLLLQSQWACKCPPNLGRWIRACKYLQLPSVSRGKERCLGRKGAERGDRWEKGERDGEREGGDTTRRGILGYLVLGLHRHSLIKVIPKITSSDSHRQLQGMTSEAGEHPTTGCQGPATAMTGNWLVNICPKDPRKEKDCAPCYRGRQKLLQFTTKKWRKNRKEQNERE